MKSSAFTLRMAFAAAAFGLALAAGFGALVSGRAPAGSAPDDFDWARCEVVERAGTVREVRCPTFRLRLMRGPTLSNTTGLIAIARAELGESRLDAEPLRRGNRSAPLVVGERVVLAAPIRQVISICNDETTDARDRCRRAIEWMFESQRLPPGVSFPEARFEFLGHQIAIPEGCSLVGTERIVCAGTGNAVDWREARSTPGRSPDSALDGFVDLFRQRVSVVEVVPVACSLRATPGVGRRISATLAGQPIDVVACALERDGTISVAQCIGRVPRGGTFPVPCAGVFDGPVP